MLPRLPQIVIMPSDPFELCNKWRQLLVRKTHRGFKVHDGKKKVLRCSHREKKFPSHSPFIQHFLQLFDVFDGGAQSFDFAHLLVLDAVRDSLTQGAESRVHLFDSIALTLVPAGSDGRIPIHGKSRR